MYVLGIDGGGTMTSGIVADETGEICMEAHAGPSNPSTLTGDELEEVLMTLISQLKKQDPVIFAQLAVCFAGMSGAGDSSKRDAEFLEILARLLPGHTQVIIRNDSYNALYAETLGNPGIVQIAGTGSITFGLNGDGRTARSGGWGYLFDQAGSGFHLGNETLRAVFRNYDGRGPDTELTEKVLNYFQATEVTELISEIHGPEHPRSVIAKLAPLTIAAAENGDEVAEAIIFSACEEIMNCIETCHAKLFEADHPTIVVLAGGVFAHSRKLVCCLNKMCKRNMPNIIFRQAAGAPVGGAVIGGLKAMGISEVDESIIQRIQNQLKKTEV